jgi:hypothetical protein
MLGSVCDVPSIFLAMCVVWWWVRERRGGAFDCDWRGVLSTAVLLSYGVKKAFIFVPLVYLLFLH